MAALKMLHQSWLNRQARIGLPAVGVNLLASTLALARNVRFSIDAQSRDEE